MIGREGFLHLTVEPVNNPVLEKRGILAWVHKVSYRFFRFLLARMGTKIVRVAIFSFTIPNNALDRISPC